MCTTHTLCGTRSPTFYQDIKPLFTEFDRVKMKYFIDLWNYHQVKAHAITIHLCLQPRVINGKPDPEGWSMLPQVHVMPKGAPWPQEHIDLFGRWIELGCPAGVIDTMSLSCSRTG